MIPLVTSQLRARRCGTLLPWLARANQLGRPFGPHSGPTPLIFSSESTVVWYCDASGVCHDMETVAPYLSDLRVPIQPPTPAFPRSCTPSAPLYECMCVWLGYLMISLFSRSLPRARSPSVRLLDSFAKETYIFKEPPFVGLFCKRDLYF